MIATLDLSQMDRVRGVLVGTAAGDALGAGYEFGPALSDDTPVVMDGGGPFRWEPGEWTDDTAMAIAIAEVAATGADLRGPTGQDAVINRWIEWMHGAKDVGSQTREVLGMAGEGGAEAARAAARRLHERTGRTAGNGALMRTAPVALAFLEDPRELARAAAVLAELTHYDPEAGEASALWCLAIRHAVLTGEMDSRAGLDELPKDRASLWATRLDEAERSRPADFSNNGWVVRALQAAWSAVAGARTPGTDPATHLRRGLEAAVRGGRDTDTVAAIAGGLLGAAHGASAVPDQWRILLHGWPGLTATGLADLATAIVTASPGSAISPAGRGSAPTADTVTRKEGR